jgi:hypothetical protein
MPATYGPLIKAELRANDCYFERHGKGDHEIWFSPITNRYLTVDSGTKSRHTANAVMKQAGINRRF